MKRYYQAIDAQTLKPLCGPYITHPKWALDFILRGGRVSKVIPTDKLYLPHGAQDTPENWRQYKIVRA